MITPRSALKGTSQNHVFQNFTPNEINGLQVIFLKFQGF